MSYASTQARVRATDDACQHSSPANSRFTLRRISPDRVRNAAERTLHALISKPVLRPRALDTGNAYLCGHDPYPWLEKVVNRLVHLHAKDISVEHSSKERGKVTGTPVGCACGDGVIDWKRIIASCRKATRDIVLSVECGTVEQAKRSIEHLRELTKEDRR